MIAELLLLVKNKVFWLVILLVAVAAFVSTVCIDNSHLQTEVVTLKADVVSAQKVIDEKTLAAKTCSDATTDLRVREDALKAKLASASAAASSAAQAYRDRAKKFEQAQPTSTNDADAANTLFNSALKP